MFKIGDIVKLKSTNSDGIFNAFETRGITKDQHLKIVNITGGGSLGFEGGWERDDFYNYFFELATNRKERIDRLFNQ